MGIISPITIRLAEKSVAGAVGDPALTAVTKALRPFQLGGHQWRSIASKKKVAAVDETQGFRAGQKNGLEDFPPQLTRFEQRGRIVPEVLKQVLYRFLLDGGSFLAFAFWAFGFHSFGALVAGKVVLIQEPQAIEEAIEGSDAGHIIGIKPGDEGKEGNELHLIHPFGDRSRTPFRGQHQGTYHVGWPARFRSILGVARP